MVAKTAKKALKSGKITREKDYYILKELEDSIDQTILTDNELDAVSNLLRHFEGR